MKDPYDVLGVSRTAAADEIKQAYRRLARELHPDVNPGDKKSEERFKEITAAWDFLSDPEKRGQYDRGEIDATGAQKRRGWRGQPGGGARGDGARGGNRSGFHFGEDVDDILSELLRRKERGRGAGGGQGAGGPRPKRGAEARHTLAVSFVDAAAGATKRVTLTSGRTVEVRIPPGTTDGQTLRLKGQGHDDPAGGGAGDAYIELKVEAHPFFTRRDQDIIVELPVSLQEAVLGGKITVPTIDGRVAMTVPAGSNSGTVLRLKGRGVAGADGTRGDQLVTLKVVLPEGDAELKAFVEKWGPRSGYDPRSRGWGEA